MSQDNLERLRETYKNFAKDGLDMNPMTADIEFRQPDEIGGGEGVYHGHEGVIRGVQELQEVFDDVDAVPEKFFVTGPYIVVFVRLCGRAKRSGVPIEAPFAHVWRFRGEQVDL